MRFLLIAVLGLFLTAGAAVAGPLPTPGVPVDANNQVPGNYLNNISGRSGLRVSEIGDSRIGNGIVIASVAGGGYAYPVYLFTTSCYLCYANALTGGRLDVDPINFGYSGGIYRGLLKVTVGVGGSNYTAPTITTNCPGAVIGTPVLSGGAIVSVPVSNAGTGNCAQPATVTISDSTGSGAVLVPIVGGLGTFGQGGEQACATQYRVGDITPTLSDVALVQDGTNDAAFGVSGPTIIQCIKNILQPIIVSGKRVIYTSNLPRGASSGIGAITHQQAQVLNTVDRSLRFWLAGIGNNDTRFQGAALLDVARECTDATSAQGYPLQAYSTTLPDCMPDGLHLGYGGAVIFAQKLLLTLNSWGISFAPASNLSVYDNFDATYDPGGFLNSNPLMTGAGGAPGTGCSGTVPTDYGVQVSSGTSNATCMASIESPRTDGFSGQRAVVTVSGTSGGGTLANYKLNTSHGLATFNLSVGDPVYGEAEIEVTNSLKMTALTLDITFLNSSSQTLQDCAWGSTYGAQGYYADTGVIGTLSPASPLLAVKSLRPITPRGPAVCQVPAGTNTVSFSMIMGADFSGAASSAAFTVKVGEMSLHKFTY